MIRTKPKEPYKGLKRTPMKRKPPKVRTAFPKILRSRELPTIKKRRGLRIRVDALDSLFSLYIRLRDNYTCQQCGVKSKNVQCAHFHSRRKQSVRYDPDNACSLGMGCHQYLDGNPMEKVEFFKSRLGEIGFDLLNSRARITYPKPDKQAIKLYLQNKIAELEKKY
jgi:5-methylcytosine-specific restriction endonuclease McrA